MAQPYHLSRAKALSESFAFDDPNTPRVTHLGCSSHCYWDSETIESVGPAEGNQVSICWDTNAEELAGQSLHSAGHFPRQQSQVIRVNNVPNSSEYGTYDDTEATPEVTGYTVVKVAEVQHKSTVGRAGSIVLKCITDLYRPISRIHARFICLQGIWAIEDLGSVGGTVVNGVYIQGTKRSSSSRSSSKRTFSQISQNANHSFSASDAFSQTSFQDVHRSFSACDRMSQNSSSQNVQRSLSASDSLSQRSSLESRQIPAPKFSRLMLRPNEVNEIEIGAYRLFMTPYWKPTNQSPAVLDPLHDRWQSLFGLPENFWHCYHCEGREVRVAVSKYVPAACELLPFDKSDIDDFLERRQKLQPLDRDDRYLERCLAIFDGNGNKDRPFVATLLHMSAPSLEEISRDEVLDAVMVRRMLKDLLTALSLHAIDHGSISKATIFVLDGRYVQLRGFMRTAKLRVGRDVEDLFKIFRSIYPVNFDHKFNRYLSQHFDSVRHANDQFPSPDAEFMKNAWTREIYVHHEDSKSIPGLKYIAIGELCDKLLLEAPSQAAEYIRKLRAIHKPKDLDANFDHCTSESFARDFAEEHFIAHSVFSQGEISVLSLTGHGVFVDCSRLRLWADQKAVKVFDQDYEHYDFLDVISDDESLNGSYAPSEDIAEIVARLNLPEDCIPNFPHRGHDASTRPKVLFYLNDLLGSVVKYSDGKTIWLTSGPDESRPWPSEFAQLIYQERSYPHIFRTVPRALLDDFKFSIMHAPPGPPEDTTKFRFGLSKKRRQELSLSE